MPNNIVDNIEQCFPNKIVASCFQQLLIFGRVGGGGDDLLCYLDFVSTHGVATVQYNYIKYLTLVTAGSVLAQIRYSNQMSH